MLIYYANETSKKASQSLNYARLISALDRSGSSLAADLKKNVLEDARVSPAVVERDVADLIAVGRDKKIDVAIFTNALALQNMFLIYNSANDLVARQELTDLPAAQGNLLDDSPLSRPQALRAALLAVTAKYVRGEVDAVLIVNSHGSEDMVLMPRVNTDLSVPRAVEQFLAGLDSGGAASAPPRPDWATLKGANKVQFWKVLGDISVKADIRFPLVFLESCESGVSSWGQFLAIPPTVAIIAHTADAHIRPLDINYAELLKSENRDSDWIAEFSDNLTRHGIHVEAKWAQAFRPLVADLKTLPVTLFFLPLALWSMWTAASVGARVRRAKTGWGRVEDISFP
jgi:hypothetical protein